MVVVSEVFGSSNGQVEGGDEYVREGGRVTDSVPVSGRHQPTEESEPPETDQRADLPEEAPDSDLLTEVTPATIARDFTRGQVWRWWSGMFLKWEGGHYQEVPESELRAEIRAYAHKVYDREKKRQLRVALRGRAVGRPREGKVNTETVTNILEELRCQNLLKVADASLPCHLTDPSRVELITLQNGILDLETGELLAHTPDYFDVVILPYDHDPEATCPIFENHLTRMFSDQPEVIPFLQEYAGYLLSPNSDAQAFLYLYGRGNTGKSTLLAALEALVGRQNTSHQDLADLKTTFGLAPLVGKKLNICTEVSELPKGGDSVFKKVVDGSYVSVNRKHQPVVDIKLGARFAFGSNEPPGFTDRSDGVYRRFVPIQVTRVVDEKTRVPGMDKPEWWENSGELPGILNWALGGLKRLRANGWRFSIPQTIRAQVEEVRQGNDPIRKYLLDNWEADPQGKAVSTTDFLGKYNKWAESHGYKKANSKEMAEGVRNTFPTVQKGSARIKGRPLEAWKGIRERREQADPGGGTPTTTMPPPSGSAPYSDEEVLEQELRDLEEAGLV
jgi:P4 family phage/plasmid primase-like protien